MEENRLLQQKVMMLMASKNKYKNGLQYVMTFISPNHPVQYHAIEINVKERARG